MKTGRLKSFISYLSQNSVNKIILPTMHDCKSHKFLEYYYRTAVYGRMKEGKGLTGESMPDVIPKDFSVLVPSSNFFILFYAVNWRSKFSLHEFTFVLYNKVDVLSAQ